MDKHIKARPKHLAACLSLGIALSFGAAAPSQALVKWTDGVVVAKADAGFFWMAQARGYFKKQGLDVKYIQFKGDKALMRALLAGDVDSIEVGPAAPLAAIDRGATNLRFIGAPMPGLSYALYVRKDITRWAQLNGKIFGVSAPGGQPDIMARVMLARKGVDPNSIKIVNAGGSAARVKALVAGKIDACESSSQFVPEAHKLGIRVMALAGDLVPEYPRIHIVVEQETLEAKREAAIRFLAAYMEGLNYAVKHRGKTLALSAKIDHKSPTDPELVYIYDEIISKHYVAVNLKIPRAKIAWLQDQLLNVGTLRKKVDLDRYIDDSYRQAALKRVNLR